MPSTQHEMSTAINTHRSQYGAANVEQLAAKLYDMAVFGYCADLKAKEAATIAVEPAPVVKPSAAGAV